MDTKTLDVDIFSSVPLYNDEKPVVAVKPKTEIAKHMDTEPLDVDIFSSVPLYNGERPVAAVKPKTSRIPVKCGRHNHVKDDDRRCGSSETRPNLPSLEHQHEKNSYVRIFQAKNSQLMKVEGPRETTRAELGDCTDRSDLSDASHFSDARSSCSDTTSFYFDLIKNMETTDHSSEDIIKSTEKSNNVDASADDEFNFKSVSQFSVGSKFSTCRSNRKNSTSLTVPKLGSLGPDLVRSQEKLNKFRKQRSYGQKASDHNRIKILEVKILKELKEEIKNSKA